ncbi:MAG: ABC transporter ATP-binding protein [Betaproteobacteria bacterium]|nr:ABC transporter ATP-binding protein [Betaproteobacteria bacterium]
MLVVEDIHTYYDESHILQGVSFCVPENTVVSVLGRNGAGKTTVLRSIMQMTPPRRGRVLFDGKPLDGLPLHRVALAGIALVQETRAIFPSLSVAENLAIAERSGAAGRRWTVERIFESFPVLHTRRDNGGMQLSGGEQQMLAIARALVANPRLILMDEPSEGLSPLIVLEVGRILARLKEERMTLLLVEQNFALATELADENIVLGKGRIRWQGATPLLRDAQEVKSTWLGV